MKAPPGCSRRGVASTQINHTMGCSAMAIQTTPPNLESKVALESESTSDSDKNPPRVEVLIGDYREARQEGMQLAQSVFTDIAIVIALISAVLGSQLLFSEPSFLLLLPFIIGGLGLYAIQKFRITSLGTSYMIYLEEEINREYPEPVTIWASVLINRNVSAGRDNRWGSVYFYLVLVVLGIIYSGICWWVIVQNHANTSFQGYMRSGYILSCAFILIALLLSANSTVRTIKKNNPAQIREVARRTFSK